MNIFAYIRDKELGSITEIKEDMINGSIVSVFYSRIDLNLKEISNVE